MKIYGASGGCSGGVAAAGQVTPAVDVWKDDGHLGPRQGGTGSRAGGVVEKKKWDGWKEVKEVSY